MDSAIELSTLYDKSDEVGEWLSGLSSAQWEQAMRWLDDRMKHESTDEDSWNDH